jgi:hypothetical protein
MALDQPHFRIRTGDTVGLNTDSGWAAALDTNASIDCETLFRIRFEVASSANEGSKTFKLQYRRNGGTWTDVPLRNVAESVQTGTDETEIVLSAQYADNDATTNLLSGSGLAFTAGVGLEDNLTPAVTINNNHTEYEWTLRIRLLWHNGTTRGRNADNDTFEYRIVESAGTVFGGTYVIPLITLNVPDGSIGGSHVETPKRMGPFKDTNGNLYIAVEYGEPNNSDELAMLKSTDGGKQWAIMNAAGAPTAAAGSDDVECMDVDQVGSVLHISIFHGGGRSKYHTFRTSDNGSPDTWGVTSETIHTAGVSPQDQDISIGVRADGTIVATYSTDPSGGFQRMAYRIRSAGGVWSGETILDTTASTNFSSAIIVLGASDLAYIIYHDDTNSRLYYKTLTSADVLSARTQFNATGTAPSYKAIPQAYYFDDNGVEVIVATYRRSSNLWERRIIGGTLQTERQISGVQIAQNRAGGQAPISVIAVWDVDIHAAYGDNTNFDLYYDISQDGAAYGTDVLKADVVSVDTITGNVFQHSAANGSALVMAVVIDDGGGGLTGKNKYIEWTVLGTIPPPPSPPGVTSFFGLTVNPADNGSLSAETVSLTPPASMLAGDLIITMGLFREQTGLVNWVMDNGGGQDWDIVGAQLVGFGCTLQRWACTFDGTWRGQWLTANQASLETDTSGWVAQFNSTIARVADGLAVNGANVLRLTCTDGALGEMDAATSEGLSGQRVKAGRQYTGIIHFRTGVTSRTCFAAISWWDVNGNFLTLDLGSSITDVTGSYTKAFVTATAPTEAHYASVRAVINAPATSEQHFIDAISFTPGPSTTFYMPTSTDLVLHSHRGSADTITGAMFVFRPSLQEIAWNAESQTFTFIDDDANGDCAFPAQTIVRYQTVALVEWHRDVLHTFALQSAGWVNPGSITQWRNTAGSDQVLTVAYKIFDVIGSTGSIVNRANPVGAFVGSTYTSYFEVKPPTTHIVKPKQLHRASRW